MEIHFRPVAIDDLDDILHYFASDNPQAALDIITEIEDFCFTTLANNPDIGASRDKIIKGLQIFPIHHYLICYFVQDDHINVARIIHGAQDYKSLL